MWPGSEDNPAAQEVKSVPKSGYIHQGSCLGQTAIGFDGDYRCENCGIPVQVVRGKEMEEKQIREGGLVGLALYDPRRPTDPDGHAVGCPRDKPTIPERLSGWGGQTVIPACPRCFRKVGKEIKEGS